MVQISAKDITLPKDLLSPVNSEQRRNTKQSAELAAGTSSCSSCYWFCFDQARRFSRGRWGKESPCAKETQERNGNLQFRLDARSLLQKLDPSRPFSKDYRTLGYIGKGTYGAVYRVEHRRTGEVRASKEISLKTDEDRKFAKNELEAMVLLDHPNVLKLYEYFEDLKAIYLICEVCMGGDFHTLCSGSQDIDEIRALYYDVFKALAYCHDQKFAHRDMKMENCLIDTKSAMWNRNIGKVIDFGLAGIKRSGDGDNFMNTFVGSKYYVAPEIVDSRIHYGFGCDIWAVGVMLYITVTDDHPVVNNAWNLTNTYFYKQVMQYKSMRIQPLEDHGIESSLKSLLKGLLQKDARKRLTAQQAEEHEWLQKASSRSSMSNVSMRSSLCVRSSFSLSSDEMTDSPEAIVKRAMTFRQASRFEKAILAITAYQEESEELEFLREVFMLFDTAGNGTLSKEELAKGVKDSGMNMSKEEIDGLFEALDEDRTGKVHFCEFLAGTLHPAEVSTQRAIDEVFDFFDLDRSGRVKREELCKVLGNDAAALSVLAAANAEGNGYLCKDDFARMMREVAKGMEARYQSLQ